MSRLILSLTARQRCEAYEQIATTLNTGILNDGMGFKSSSQQLICGVDELHPCRVSDFKRGVKTEQECRCYRRESRGILNAFLKAAVGSPMTSLTLFATYIIDIEELMISDEHRGTIIYPQLETLIMHNVWFTEGLSQFLVQNSGTLLNLLLTYCNTNWECLEESSEDALTKLQHLQHVLLDHCHIEDDYEEVCLNFEYYGCPSAGQHLSECYSC